MYSHNLPEKRVGIGEIKVEQGDIVLSAYGVGSCVVILLYENKKKIGGLAHCLLPCGNGDCLRYPRGALAEMIKRMREMGAHMDSLVAKVIGGATMFEGFSRHEIGKRNVKETRKECERMNIPIIAEDVFGNWGRTVFFNIQNGEVRVRSFKHGEKVL